MYSLACRDLGEDCDYVATGMTKEEVMQKGAEHGMQVHGMSQEDLMKPEMVEKAMSMMKEE